MYTWTKPVLTLTFLSHLWIHANHVLPCQLIRLKHVANWTMRCISSFRWWSRIWQWGRTNDKTCSSGKQHGSQMLNFNWWRLLDFFSWQDWVLGDWVIWGVWYERLRLGSRSYILLKDSPLDFVYFHLIIASKFKMPPTTHSVRDCNATYELVPDVINVMQGLETHVLVDANED
jgi:hypothetical protein